MNSPLPESLLAHTSWVRALAYSLVHDDQSADDIVQETWLAALRFPPRRLSRTWLGRVVRNTARSHWRRELRTKARERIAARPERERSTDELVTEAEWQRHVVAAVLELDTPHRDVLLLRYFENLTPSEIAHRLDEPAGTIRSRLKRALDVLRARFDREHDGDRSAWVLTIIPVPKAATNGMFKASVGAVVVGCVLLVGWHWGGDENEEGATARAANFEQGSSISREESIAKPVPTRVVLGGRVLGKNGRPVAGARVTAGEDFALSASDGTFRLHIPSGESTQVHARAMGHGGTSLRIAIATDCGDLVMQLRPAAEFIATVTDVQGLPVADAELRIRSRSDSFVEVARTGADGIARIADVPVGWFTVFVSHSEFAPMSASIAHPAERLEFHLDRGTTFEGTTLDRATRMPVEGVRVRLILAGGETPLPDGPVIDAMSDARGRFRLDRVPITESFDLEVDAGPRGRLVRRWVRATDLDLFGVVLLDAAHVVRGVVRGPDGAAISGLTLRPWDTARVGEHLITTDALGRFALSGYPPRGNKIGVVSDVWLPSAIKDNDTWDLRVAPRPVARGRVVDERGVPIPGARVTGDDAGTLSDNEGRFALRKRTREKVRVRKHGYRTAYAEGGRVVLRPLGCERVTGRVTAPDGTPVGGARIQCNRIEPGVLEVAFYASTWPDGTFSLTCSEPGRHRLLVQRTGWRGTQLEVDSGDSVAVTLDRGCTLTGVVTDRSGMPIAGVAVSVEKFMSLTSAPRTRTDASGRFQIEGAHAGRCKVKVHAFGRPQPDISVTLPRDEPLHITLDRGAVIEGVVLRANGAPVVRASLRASQVDMYAETGFDGRFRFEGLKAGATIDLIAKNLRVRSEAAAAEVFPIVRAVAGDRTVVVRAYEGQSIGGRVLGLDDAPLAGVRISANGRERRRSDSDGRFRFVGLPRGPTRIALDDERYYLDQEREWTAADDPITLRARKTLSVSGRVTGEMPKTCWVVAKPEVGDGAARSCGVAEDGTFTVKSLTPGIWILTIRVPGVSRINEQRVSAGATDVELAIR